MIDDFFEVDLFGVPSVFSAPLGESVCREMGLILEGVEPNDAIVHYPVTINGETHTEEGVPYHITLRWGKWNETEGSLVEKVRDAIKGLSTKRPKITEWRPEIFRGKDADKEFHVLAFTATPELKSLRVALESVFGPDPFPEFKPHISVDKVLWDKISKEKLLPGDIGVEVQPLEVAMGNSSLETLGESLVEKKAKKKQKGLIGKSATLALFRGTADIPPLMQDPLYRGQGIFGEGTYFGLDFGTTQTYTDSASQFGMVAEYEGKFSNLVSIDDNDVDGLSSAGATDTITFQEGGLEKMGYDYTEHGYNLASHRLTDELDQVGADAILLEGHVDGGEQVIVPPNANPSIKLKRFWIHLHDEELRAELSKKVMARPSTSGWIPCKLCQDKMVDEYLRSINWDLYDESSKNLTVDQDLNISALNNASNELMQSGTKAAKLESICRRLAKLNKVLQVNLGQESLSKRQSLRKSFNEATLINLDLNFLNKLAQNTMPQFSLSKNLELIDIYEKHLGDIVAYRVWVIADGEKKTFKFAVTAGGFASVGNDVRNSLEKYNVLIAVSDGESGHLEESKFNVFEKIDALLGLMGNSSLESLGEAKEVTGVPQKFLDFVDAWDEYLWDHAETLLKDPELIEWLDQYRPKEDVILYRGIHIHPEMIDRWIKKGGSTEEGSRFSYSEKRHSSWSRHFDIAKNFIFYGEDGETGLVLKSKISSSDIIFDVTMMPKDLVLKINKLPRIYDEQEVIVRPGNHDVEVVYSCSHTRPDGKCLSAQPVREAKGDWEKEGIKLSLKLSRSKFGDIPEATVVAETSDGSVAGIAEFEQVGGDWEPQSINVGTRYQRKGIATAMYDFIRKETGMKVIPSQSQTGDGRKLWKSFGESELEIDSDDKRMLWFHEPHPESLPSIPNMTPEQASIAFAELAKATTVRDGSNGIEYLLYRGVDSSHLKDVVGNVFNSKYRSSWTPNFDTAKHFARDRMHQGFVISGWVPQAGIVMIPKHFMKYAGIREYEVVVDSNVAIDIEAQESIQVYKGNESVDEWGVPVQEARITKAMLTLKWDEILDYIEKHGVWELKANHPKEYQYWNQVQDKRHKDKLKELYGRAPSGDNGWAREKNTNDRLKRLGLKESVDSWGIPLTEESELAKLKEVKKKLSDDERAEVMKSKAVWHHGPNGEETSAIWKAELNGKTYYCSNTHRAWSKSTTLKDAIKRFHEYVKESS